MNLARLTFNNFFDYLIIAEQLHRTEWAFNPNEFIIIFHYILTAEYAIKYVENLCKPLNIQFTTTLEVVEDIEWTQYISHLTISLIIN